MFFYVPFITKGGIVHLEGGRKIASIRLILQPSRNNMMFIDKILALSNKEKQLM